MVEVKNHETKYAFHHYGLTDLSDLIRARQNTLAFKVKRKYGSGEFTNYWFSLSRPMTNQKITNMRNIYIFRMSKS